MLIPIALDKGLIRQFQATTPVPSRRKMGIGRHPSLRIATSQLAVLNSTCITTTIKVSVVLRTLSES